MLHFHYWRNNLHFEWCVTRRGNLKYLLDRCRHNDWERHDGRIFLIPIGPLSCLLKFFITQQIDWARTITYTESMIWAKLLCFYHIVSRRWNFMSVNIDLKVLDEGVLLDINERVYRL